MYTWRPSSVAGHVPPLAVCMFCGCSHCSNTQCPEHAPWRHSSSRCSNCVSTRLTSVYPARHSSIAMTSTSFSCTGKRVVIQLRLTPFFQERLQDRPEQYFLRQQCTKQWLYCEYIYCDVRDGGEGIITSVKLENLPSHVLAEVTVELYPPYDLIRFENSNLIQSAVSECVK